MTLFAQKEEGRLQVALISYTAEPERTVAAAARLSASPVGAAELLQRMTPERVASLLQHLMNAGHLSPFEHASFTFAVEGISRACSHQLVRHRLASYTQQSQRYVSLKTLPYIIPESIAAKGKLLGSYRAHMEASHKLYREFLEQGVPAEDARYLLPNATETKLVLTMNARELMHVCGVRLCLRAQWEIVELFEKVKIEVSQVAPFIARELKPKCYGMGYCDEDESCGLIPTLKELADETVARGAGAA